MVKLTPTSHSKPNLVIPLLPSRVQPVRYKYQVGKSYGMAIVIIFLLAMVVFAVWWFRANYERVTLDPEIELSVQARQNRFYAAELYLTQLGIATQTERGRDTLINLPSSQDTLIIKSMGQSFNNQRVEHLVKWIKQGGQVITFANGYWYDDIEGVASMTTHVHDENDAANAPIVYQPYYLDEGNKLLDYLGIYYYYPEDYINCGDDEEAYQNQEHQPNPSVVYDERCAVDESVDTDTPVDTTATDSNVADEQSNYVADRTLTATVDGKAVNVQMDAYKAVLWINPELTPIWHIEKYNHEPQMVQFALGKGRLTVFTDSQFMQNPDTFVVDNILRHHSLDRPETKPQHTHTNAQASNAHTSNTAEVATETQTTDSNTKMMNNYRRISLVEADNAYLLWYLVKDSHKVWLLPDIDNNNLFELLWAKAKYACMSFAVLLLFWLWWQMRRFGPIKQQLDLPRRNLIEHLNMVGLFAWRLDKANRLLSQNRHGLKKTLLTHYPKLTQLEAKDFSHQLSEHIDMPAATIYTALFAPINSESDFIQVTHLMQQLTHQL